MKAALCEQLGDPSSGWGSGVLRIVELPHTSASGSAIKIRVTAASLNFPDVLQIQGQYQVKPKLPFVPGNEVSGIVVQVGDKAKMFKVGDKVCAVSQGGAFAEELVVHEASAWLIPEGVELAAAAAIPIVFGTVHLSLVHRAQLKAGQTLLVFGAAGGVGLAAVQMGKLLGARVIAVATGAGKADVLRRCGADAVVDAAECGPERPLHEAIRQHAPRGVNVVFDPVGAPVFSAAFKVVAWGAQYLLVGFAGGAPPSLPANLLLVKNLTAHGVFWGSYMTAEPATLAGGMHQVMDWLRQGMLTVHVSHRFPLEKLPEAFGMLMGRQVIGKALVIIDPAAQSRL